MQLAFVLVTCLLSLVTAVGSSRVVTGQFPLHKVKDGDRATKSSLHEVIVSIKLNDYEQLKTFVDDISSPLSPNYGNYLTRSELAVKFSNYEGLEHVKSFFEQKKFIVTKVSPFGEFVHIQGSISQWEEVLVTKFYEVHDLRATDTSRSKSTHFTSPLLRAREYTIPNEIQKHVKAMFNTIQIPPKFKKTSITTSAPIQSDLTVVNGTLFYPGFVTPALLYKQYNITSNIGNDLTSQALWESLGEDYSPDDLTEFQKQFELAVNPIVGDFGGFNSSSYCVNPPPTGDCGEANLDVQ